MNELVVHQVSVVPHDTRELEDRILFLKAKLAEAEFELQIKYDAAVQKEVASMEISNGAIICNLANGDMYVCSSDGETVRVNSIKSEVYNNEQAR